MIRISVSWRSRGGRNGLRRTRRPASRRARRSDPTSSRPMTTPSQLHLRLTSDPAHLAPVRHQLEEFCASCGFFEGACGEIALVVNEAMTNVTRHAYGGAHDGTI